MAPRNILHLIDTGGPGGAETVYATLLARLDPGRWRSIAVVPEVDWLHGALRSAGVEPLVVPTHGSFDIRYLRRLHGIARRNGAEIIHAHLLTSGVYGGMLGRLRGVPVVCTFHGHADVPADERFRAVKFRILDHRRNRIVFVSAALRRAFLRRHRLDPARTEVIPNGIDARVFRAGTRGGLRAELGLPETTILVGAVGNIRASKDYPTLLRAAAALRRRSAAYRVVIVGDTRDAGYDGLLALRSSLGLDQTVIFTGFREDVHGIMGDFDIYVISSSAEGFSLSTIQAMACGVPVVATRCGGPEEIIEDGVTGVLVPTGAPEALADAVHALAGDVVRRERFSRVARERVERRFTVESMVQAYSALYERCLADARPVRDGVARRDVTVA
ncbi:MAG TPA: glycosyltransferase [Longimicrobiales bacterium]